MATLERGDLRSPMRLLRPWLTLPIVLATGAHASAWAFAVFWIRTIRQEALSASDPVNSIAETALASPVIFTLIALICAIRKRGWETAAVMTAIAIFLAFLGSLSFGPYLWPTIALMGWATVKLSQAERDKK